MSRNPGGDTGAATTVDEFLGGKLRVEQPIRGHRSGSDAVLLAAAAPVQAGERIADLGTGVGVALLCLLARVPGSEGVGIDIDEAAIELATRNAARNRLARRAQFFVGDLERRLPQLAAGSFDHVIANPPFFVAASGTASAQASRRQARAAAPDLFDVWARRAADLLRHGGVFTLILRSERLADALAALGKRFGAIEVLPLRTGPSSDRVILQVRKGSRAPLTLAAEIVLQEKGRYLPAIQKVLLEGAALRPAAALPPASAPPSGDGPAAPRRNRRSGRGTGGAS
ncbi:tRNA1(Val) (adenine(37)-N6)-methyltransferase [Desertibaculum subflavum]|uniref:tRNA1(Val) (adenine(37)-N6)-methyltransferase n=1 Tax=Desertibaculum subflavum TaxID=2268458 RepID=UPI000E662E4B